MTSPPLTYESAVRILRSQPSAVDLIRSAYLDADPLLACERFAVSEEFQAAAELLGCDGRGGARLIDLGAGNGIASYAFALRGFKVTAVEPDRSEEVGAGAIRRVAAKTGVPIRVVQSFGEALPFGDRTFDFAYARQVMHHAQNLEQMVAETHRVLRPGARLLVAREHVADDEAQLLQFLSNHPLHPLTRNEHAYPLSEYVNTFNKAGFRIDRVLHPFATVVNFAPMSKSELSARGMQWARRRLGAAALLLGRRNLDRLYAWKQGKAPWPGRLYSFLLTRTAP